MRNDKWEMGNGIWIHGIMKYCYKVMIGTMEYVEMTNEIMKNDKWRNEK